MSLKDNISRLYGERGLDWLTQVPTIVERLSAQWGLSELMPVDNMTYNYVLSGIQANQPIILKLGMDLPRLKHEAQVLNAFKGYGAVRILASDTGALLMERAVPGVSLRSFFPKEDLEAVEVVCQVMKKLHQAPLNRNNNFAQVDDWLLAIDHAAQIPSPILVKARKLRDNLIGTSGPKVLLHGDLHHDNILKHGDDWIVIDPKGVIGERTYEIAAFIRNPVRELLSMDNAHEIIVRRINHFAQCADLDPKRIQDWCFVQSVLSWCWALEDGIDADYFARLTKILQTVVRQ
ncbi:MAG: aminoglycoside phosphotransferase family protein [Gammaproteobacteria bacterium]